MASPVRERRRLCCRLVQRLKAHPSVLEWKDSSEADRSAPLKHRVLIDATQPESTAKELGVSSEHHFR